VGVGRLNHAVLYVADLTRSALFYEDVLGFERLPGEFPGGIFLRAAGSANDHDLGLFQARTADARGGASVGLYHLAWEADTLAELTRLRGRLATAGALTGASNHGATKSLYGRDPDGIEFEVCWLVPDALLAGELVPGMPPTRPLDLAAEIRRYGATTPGGPRADRALLDGLLAAM